jgi:hypothetical protein
LLLGCAGKGGDEASKVRLSFLASRMSRKQLQGVPRTG